MVHGLDPAKDQIGDDVQLSEIRISIAKSIREKNVAHAGSGYTETCLK